MQKRLRKTVLLGAALLLSVGILTGCGDKNDGKQEETAPAEQTEERQEQKEADDTETNLNAVQESEDAEEIELETVEQPQFITGSLRKLTLVQNGEEIFQISREPEEYKMSFDYWEIQNPYDESATVDTEAMYNLFGIISTLNLTTPVKVEEGIDTGIRDSKTSMTIEFVNTLDGDTAAAAENADSTATILIGNEDGEGYRYAAVEGYEDTIYKLSTSVLYSIYALEPFDYILKIPVLINLDTVESVDIAVEGNTYTMEKNGEEYRLGKKEVEKETFTTLYQALMNVTLASEIQETKSDGEKEELLKITFHRNMEKAPETELVYYTYDDTYDSVEVNGKEYFLVKAEEVEALIAQIQEAY